MRASHFKRTLLVFAIQVVGLTAAFCLEPTRLDWLATIGFFAAYLVPFVGYIVVLYNAPMFTDRSRLLKTAALTILSIAATFGGTMLVFLAFLLSGFPFPR